MPKRSPCLLMILDGWGIAPASAGNAVAHARTPFLDRLAAAWPHARLACSGEAVGLPAGIMGNSEVGHLNLGAGRVVMQDLLRIDRAIEEGAFFDNPALAAAMDAVRSGGRTLHLIGLVSDGGVHSQLSHLTALLNMAADRGVPVVRVHAVLDGRDTPPDSGRGFLDRLQAHLPANGSARLASVCGRFYAMDRDTRWERVQRAYAMLVEGRGETARDPLEAVDAAYARGETDEFISPVVITDDAGNPLGKMGDGDAVIFFNFRADRARELTRALTAENFDGFVRARRPRLSRFVCMTLYDERFDLPVAFPPETLRDIFGQVISRAGLTQLRIAETEKYAHVTYFFNGGEETAFDGEERCLVPSPRDIATYDQRPEMSAPEVTREVLARLDTGRYAVVVLNFANLDMVGHTGDFEAAVQATETVDACVARIVPRVLESGGTALVTADHGNAEQMRDAAGGRYTAHSLNPVPVIVAAPRYRRAALRNGRLADVAPTLLHLLGIAQPPAMTGRSLLETATHGD